MINTQTQMKKEILEIPDAVERLITNGQADIRSAALKLRERDPNFLISVARGSSDHVATYFKYSSELLLGIPVASIGPSIASVYKKKLKLSRSGCISISQSGMSPDIVEMSRMAQDEGALTIAITNQLDSPLSQVSDCALDLYAGEEKSVAATKTFINSAVTGILLLAEWANDDELRRAINGLPKVLEKAVLEDWPDARAALVGKNSVFCLGRGATYAFSNEAALKLKETCQIHAESYSSAEVLHGPVSIVGNGFPIIALASTDQAEASLVAVADEFSLKGANVFATSKFGKSCAALRTVRTGHPLTDPLALITSFYSMVEKVSVSRGINPDAPRHLNKVTKTL